MKTLLLSLAITATALAQSVTDSTLTFRQVTNQYNQVITDTIGDQQTGQGADDFVVNGLFIKYGKLGTDQTQFVRVIFDKYQANGFGGNVRLGVDVNADGAVDLYYGVSDSGSIKGITFQNPVGGANVSPSTSSLSTAYNTIALSSTNYNYQQVDAVSNDAALTFAISFSSLQSALSVLGFSITETTFLRYIAFTATQTNTINQDVYGMSSISGGSRFDSGYFTRYEDFYGTAMPIPEPSTYFQILSMLGVAGLIRYRRYLQRYT